MLDMKRGMSGSAVKFLAATASLDEILFPYGKYSTYGDDIDQGTIAGELQVWDSSEAELLHDGCRCGCFCLLLKDFNSGLFF